MKGIIFEPVLSFNNNIMNRLSIRRGFLQQWAVLSMALSFVLFSAFRLSPNAGIKQTGFTVVIDAGHGGKDPGCIGHGKDVFEKDIALSIALKIGQMLKDSVNTKVVYTRSTDKFVELWERAAIANKNSADVFISIHCNASNSVTAHGSETFVMGLHKNEGNLNVSKRENSAILLEEDYEKNEEYAGFDPNSPEAHILFSLYQNAFRNQSLQVASSVQQNIAKKELRKNLGVKEAGFLVLWKTAMPSILVETGFLTNPDDKMFLRSDHGQKQLAHSVMLAVKDYKVQIEKQNGKKG
jgi:N-acetylmuramoyl-L-alanine amidase